MITITSFTGVDKHLYELVAPLVMDPKVLKQNRNYPFKTAQNFIWFLASDEEGVIGFLPAEIRNRHVVLNNYYTKKEDQEILFQLIQKALSNLEEEHSLIAIVQIQHVETFKKCGFQVLHTWKQYIKMIKEK